ncbi:Uncharacterised protein [Bordetella pertussis]|nr:Uncharacterised protein [Bordetella pertussis]CFN54755.1 Uncharacterised protein [Bordetella pertussis]CFO01970.1 Uncharacterised protein [Bordetella pertussis]CFO30120.1 Uncharacterised protein [Bordetella pertussis]CFP07454.1 Uncharacterised protein [Bordetella pertussis]
MMQAPSSTANRMVGLLVSVNRIRARMQPTSVPIRRQPLRWRVSAKPGFMMMTMVSSTQ